MIKDNSFYQAIPYASHAILCFPSGSESMFIFHLWFVLFSGSGRASSIVLGLALDSTSKHSLDKLLGYVGLDMPFLCQAVFFPLLLTSLLYGGSFVSKTWKLIASRKEGSRENSCSGFDMCVLRCMDWITAYARNVMAWRNYVVAPFTEELVFRACMIPLLLCGGFGTSSIIFLSPVFFSLAHLNHFLELYYQRRYRFTKAFLIVGLQLGYTVIFGWFASFLFIRTGNLISPIVAHVFCNVMGLPVLSCPRTKGLATLAAAAGVLCFLWLLFPATSPYLYNDLRDGCSCWHRYCSWS
ncbi:hypothetical protein ZIOFF_066256 [Zingiber officinale]|uniref:intramembrane prenyl-peptidase Rce1 n=1 Tax=Zingiber officinale TaxID=94328 RepID=A0A8J5F2Z1_ZINOF|nr:hypothetical protein ZIOFF_066256 [Zingiber officinale]